MEDGATGRLTCNKDRAQSRFCVHVLRIDALIAALRSSSASYQSFNARAVNALGGFSLVEKPMLAITERPRCGAATPATGLTAVTRKRAT